MSGAAARMPGWRPGRRYVRAAPERASPAWSPRPACSCALVGALVVLAADFAGQHLVPVQLPVGVLTAIIGAPYLLYLVLTTNKIGQGG